MLREAELAQVKVSVRERALRQRWRMQLLWVLRAFMALFLVLVVKVSLERPFADIDAALDACVEAAPIALQRTCVHDAIASRRDSAEQVRNDVLGLIAFLGLTIALAFLVRLGLREQLREQARFSEQVFDAVPLPMSLRTAGGVFLRVNAAFEQQFGLKAAAIAGHHFSEYFPPAIVREVERMDALAIAATEPIQIEFDTSTSARPQHIVRKVQSVRDEDGSVIGLVMVRDDITALRLKEADLTESNERLRRLSAQMLDSQEAERRRIARDLHDEVGQILTALKLQLGLIVQAGTAGDLRAALQPARDFAEEALRHTRDLSASLHPHLLDDLGLEVALAWLVDRFVRPLVASVDLCCRLAPARAAQQIELVAFRVVQEALTNAARHAHATRIGVILAAEGGTLSIEVIDDGVGFEGGHAAMEFQRGSSLGLAAMSDRVAEAGGELDVVSTPGAGTKLRARLPWPGAAA
jgi:two-component system, NarL family, sensor histidine kinase UhpB